MSQKQFTIAPLNWRQLDGEVNPTYVAHTVFGRYFIIQRNGIWENIEGKAVKSLEIAQEQSQQLYEEKLCVAVLIPVVED